MRSTRHMDHNSNHTADTADIDGKCLACHSAPLAYETASCHHACFCKQCAMKCATGGKCKVCGELFGELRRIGTE
jgi:hypothetical protein